MTDFQSNEVHLVFNHYPERYQKSLLTIRALIFDVASKTEDVGVITEMLKWGQPSYNRAIVLEPKNNLPIDELSICIEMALTYKLRKKR
ncbi:hypothetical protein [Xenorhabdus doucetiae]|uniref:YdhG-like domain-containing protein n=1 Tax=Xenorhabdus doucetiae TaxID=351671 RepID=A0A068QS62_9GAMM|nr:hypothetical protein [Xenorhabdus doucetiae]TYO99776.1 hypothetical protein LY16_03105 [Xenorhabdus doucetiae]CDG17634.1 conserved protein of unknown function [Xenorhabdus doucetiae]